MKAAKELAKPRRLSRASGKLNRSCLNLDSRLRGNDGPLRHSGRACTA
jgi:hypothetical protein